MKTARLFYENCAAFSHKLSGECRMTSKAVAKKDMQMEAENGKDEYSKISPMAVHLKQGT